MPSSCTIRISAHAASTLAISSTAMFSISVPVPVPPYSIGNGSPRMSCSARILRMSHGYSACSSISAERGAIFSCAIWRDRGAEVEVLLGDRVNVADCLHDLDPSDRRARAGRCHAATLRRWPPAKSPPRSTSSPRGSPSGWPRIPRVQVVDVREDYERQAGHIEGSRHIELNPAHRPGRHDRAPTGPSSSTAASAPAR